MRIITLFAITAITVAAISCSGAKKSTEGMSGQEMERPAEPGPGIAPDHCRVIATIVSINEMRSSEAGDPCAQAPCIATVRIDEVLGYGSGFTSRLARGREVVLRFRYTLSPTETLFPDLSPPMPGLTAGAQFQADIVQQVSLEGSTGPQYSVGAYARR